MSIQTEYTACALDPLLASPEDAVVVSSSISAPVGILADALPQIVWTAQPDGTRDYFNQRWFEHTGQTPADMVSESWADAVHGDDRARCLMAWREAAAGNEPFEIEYRLLCADDNSYRWHMERALPLLDPSSAVVKWFGTCTDIQQLKQARSEIDDLNMRLRRAMTETHHRVKNNLQIILAMVDMQMPDDAEAIPASEMKRLGSHIRTIATVHDILTHAAMDDDSETLSIRAVLNQLLPVHQQTAPKCAIRARIEDVSLPGRKGTALALIANELISNAIKHGHTTVEVVVENANGGIRVSVCDDGRGFPADFDPATAANRGLELVQSLVRWDLGGDVTFGNQPAGGAQVTIVVPRTGG